MVICEKITECINIFTAFVDTQLQAYLKCAKLNLMLLQTFLICDLKVRLLSIYTPRYLKLKIT